MPADVVDAATRSRMMAGIRGRNTKPEILVRRGLHALGFRYRLHARLPGRPDLVLTRWRAAIFVHGCFWHGHDCPLFKWPATRQEFWRTKIQSNQSRDAAAAAALRDAGWRVLTIWECALKGRDRLPPGSVVERTAEWLRGGSNSAEIRGAGDAG